MLDQVDSADWNACLEVVRPALLLAPHNYLDDIRRGLIADGVAAAVRDRGTDVLFDWIVRLLARQGISNRAAKVFIDAHGSPTFHQIQRHLATDRQCPRLRSYWDYAGCGYRRAAATCGMPHHRLGCAVTLIPVRKGALAEAAFGFALFLRDVCSGDFVGWIDARLASADPGIGSPHRARLMRDSVLEPLINIAGTGPKTWSMILAELLLGADPARERWVTAGASFIAIDRLVHNYLARTGILRRLGVAHVFGAACYASGGCADVMAALAARIDARTFNPDHPAHFPRWVQYALWWLCAEDGLSLCNGRKIDDAVGCRQRFCPSFKLCDKIAVKPNA